MKNHQLDVQVYYEDTDHSGVVYHANYLRYFERAREHLLGIEHLLTLGREGIGFVVYKAELTYKQGAEFGDCLSIRTTIEQESPYRLNFDQQCWRDDDLLVKAIIQLVCVDASRKLIRLPQLVLDELHRQAVLPQKPTGPDKQV